MGFESEDTRESIETQRKKTVTIVIQNSEGEVLLMLRDDNPNIPFPNQWYLPGGSMEEGELPLEAVRREMREEMELELGELREPKKYEWEDKDEYVFHTTLQLDVSRINLHEGQRIAFFSREEIEKMRLAFHDQEIVTDFFKTNK